MSYSITLRSGIVARRRTFPYLREWLKLQARALRHPSETRRWLALLNADADLHRLASRQPLLVRKIYRPYLSLTLDCRQRLEALASHYGMMAGSGLMPLILSAAEQPLALARFSGKSGRSYQLSLFAAGVLDREGELVLRLLQGGAPVYSVAFSVVRPSDHSDPAVFVGCIQGPNGFGAAERIRKATRDLYGLRPKNFMVRLVRQLGCDLGCGHAILVGNRNRASHHSVRKGLVFADYDLLWRELGARACADGNFRIACEDLPHSLTLASIPSNKRGEARRRHELLHSIIAAIRASLNLQVVPGIRAASP